jgi:hypothetical protein
MKIELTLRGHKKKLEMEYKVVNSSHPEGLEKKVNKLISEGFTPTGPVQVNIIRQQNRYSGSQHMDTINTLEYVQSVIKSE